MQLRCMASLACGSTIEPPFPSPMNGPLRGPSMRSHDLLPHRSQIALGFEDRSKRKK
jgi:hypothetical protein